MFPAISAAVAKIIPLDRLRWISFSHLEADESGAMNLWLDAAPQSCVVHGNVACMVSLGDLAARPPRALVDGEAIDLGGRQIRYFDTPQVPHGWDAGLMFEETTKTLLCSDLFTHMGDPEPLTGGDILEPAMAAENAFQATALTPAIRPTILRLADLEPRRLAIMHGSSYEGDCGAALRALADVYAERLSVGLAA